MPRPVQAGGASAGSAPQSLRHFLAFHGVAGLAATRQEAERQLETARVEGRAAASAVERIYRGAADAGQRSLTVVQAADIRALEAARRVAHLRARGLDVILQLDDEGLELFTEVLP